MMHPYTLAISYSLARPRFVTQLSLIRFVTRALAKASCLLIHAEASLSLSLSETVTDGGAAWPVPPRRSSTTALQAAVPHSEPFLLLIWWQGITLVHFSAQRKRRTAVQVDPGSWVGAG